VRVFSGFAGAVVGLGFSPDGRALAARSLLGQVQVWERFDGRPVTLLKEEWAQDAAFTPEGSVLVGGAHRGAMLLWESGAGYLSVPGELTGLETSRVFLNGPRRLLAAHVRPEGPSTATQLVFCAAGGPEEPWRLTARIAPWSEQEGGPEDSAFVGDGSAFVSSYLRWNQTYTRPRSRSLRRWEPLTGAELSRLAVVPLPRRPLGHEDALFQPAPAGGSAAVVFGHEVVLVDELTYNVLPDPEPDPSPVRAVAFSPGGGLLAAASESGRVALWELNGLRRRGAYDWGVRAVRALAFAPDGLRLAAGGDEGKIVVWDLE
jgi:WD40 repeat protein